MPALMTLDTHLCKVLDLGRPAVWMLRGSQPLYLRVHVPLRAVWAYGASAVP
jgi:hypothetical protein